MQSADELRARRLTLTHSSGMPYGGENRELVGRCSVAVYAAFKRKPHTNHTPVSPLPPHPRPNTHNNLV